MSRARDLADSADKDIAGTLAVDGLTATGNISLENYVDPTIQFKDSQNWGNNAAAIGSQIGSIDWIPSDGDWNGTDRGGQIHTEFTSSFGTACALVFSTGTAASGTNEAARIDSSGNLLVGKTASNLSAAGVEALASGALFATRTGDSVAWLNKLTADGDIIRFQKDGTQVGSIGVADSGDRIYLAGGGLEGVGIDNGANAFVPTSQVGAFKDGHLSLGRSDARFTNLYLSGGVYLGGTGSANYLDDYEEGTWVPAWSVGSGQSYTRQYGTYVKIGRQVTVSCFIQTSDMNSQTGDATISGLPFTASTDTFTTLPRGFGAIMGDNGWDTNLSTNNLIAQIGGGATTIAPRKNSGSNTGTIQLQEIGGGNSYFGTTITYETDA